MATVKEMLCDVDFPQFAKVKQCFDPSQLLDDEIPQVVSDAVAQSGLGDRIKSGMRVALTGGSRGIDRIDLVTKAVVDSLCKLGAEPVIIPCMGSHGGATPQGQQDVLAHLGITQELMGAPVVSRPELICVGQTEGGRDVFADSYLASCDAILIINRVKKHTMFTAPVESGLQKMMAIGFGKQHGAEACHAEGPMGMYNSIVDYAAVMLDALPVVGGLALIENAAGKLCFLEGVLSEDITTREPELLKKANSLMPSIQFDDLDLLVVCEMGKDVSGSGMDTNIIGRYATAAMSGPRKSERLVVLSLTEQTAGNALGCGYADFTSRRLADVFDGDKTYITGLTNLVFMPTYLPPTMDNDRLAIAAGIRSCKNAQPDKIRAVIIRNTHELSEIYVSKAMERELTGRSDVELLEQGCELTFNEKEWLEFDKLFKPHKDK